MSAAPAPAHGAAGPHLRPLSEPDGALPKFALAALVTLQLALILTHEPWRDELQALMLAEHSASLKELFANLRYEGHPALWYLLLRALAPLGDAMTMLKLVQVVIALSTIALVWTRAPFGPWTRLLLLAGYLILFEWGTIARSYSLGAALYFAFLALRPPPARRLSPARRYGQHLGAFHASGRRLGALPFPHRQASGHCRPSCLRDSLCGSRSLTAWPAPDARTAHGTCPRFPAIGWRRPSFRSQECFFRSIRRTCHRIGKAFRGRPVSRGGRI